MYAYHFLNENRKLQFEPHTLVEPGQKLEATQHPLSLCEYGLHASKTVLNALEYAPGPILCRVQLSGKILHDTDKSCAEYRRCIWMFKTTQVLHEFACWCAEQALTTAKVTIDRSWNAIKVKRLWLQGLATDKELKTAHSAAHSAASHSASYSAAWSARRSDQKTQLLKMINTARRLL